MNLSSRRPITSEEVLEALHWMYKKVPSLRLYFRERNGEFWFAEMSQEILDFKVYHHGSSSIDLLHSLLHTSFDSFKGPLWRARFTEEGSSTLCPLPSLDIDFPFQSQFFFEIHHAITDGFSNLKISEIFLQLLNKVIGKISIDEKQLGVFTAGEKIKALQREKKRELLTNPVDYDKVKAEIQKVCKNVNTLWADSVGLNDKALHKTFSLNKTLNEEHTNKLLKTFKAHGVTVNSGICALINVQLAENFKEKGVVMDYYNIGTIHIVNMRRFWEPTNEFEFGLHLGLMRIFTITPGNIENDFWSYAKSVHKILQQKLADKWPVTEEVTLSEIFPVTPEELENFFLPNKPDDIFHYSLSNLGDVDQKVDGTGDHVQWTGMRRVSAIHNMNCPFGFFFQTFRKLFSYNVAYDPKYCSHEFVNFFVDAFEKILLSL